jgi:hypothetical protein
LAANHRRHIDGLFIAAKQAQSLTYINKPCAWQERSGLEFFLNLCRALTEAALLIPVSVILLSIGSGSAAPPGLGSQGVHSEVS